MREEIRTSPQPYGRGQTTKVSRMRHGRMQAADFANILFIERWGMGSRWLRKLIHRRHPYPPSARVPTPLVIGVVVRNPPPLLAYGKPKGIGYLCVMIALPKRKPHPRNEDGAMSSSPTKCGLEHGDNPLCCADHSSY